MKKILLAAIGLCLFFENANAQIGSSTDKGSTLIEANTGFGGSGLGHTSNTSFGLTSINGETAWAIGAEGGYFIIDDLALKVGLGYADGGNSIFTYKAGAKYYIASQFPFQLDFTGARIQDTDVNPLWLGIQGGYALFLNDFVSIEPGIRYNLSLNQEYSNDGIFEIRIGFAIHL